MKPIMKTCITKDCGEHRLSDFNMDRSKKDNKCVYCRVCANKTAVSRLHNSKGEKLFDTWYEILQWILKKQLTLPVVVWVKVITDDLDISRQLFTKAIQWAMDMNLCEATKDRYETRIAWTFTRLGKK